MRVCLGWGKAIVRSSPSNTITTQEHKPKRMKAEGWEPEDTLTLLMQLRGLGMSWAQQPHTTGLLGWTPAGLDNHLTSHVSKEDPVPQTHCTSQQKHSASRDGKDNPNIREQCQQLCIFCYFCVAHLLVNSCVPALAAHGMLQPGSMEASELTQKKDTLPEAQRRGGLIFIMLCESKKPQKEKEKKKKNPQKKRAGFEIS